MIPTTDEELLELMADLTEDEIDEALETLPEAVADALLEAVSSTDAASAKADTPLEQARQIEQGYRQPQHLTYLSDRLTQATHDVANGTSRMMTVSMPPRSGKSMLTSLYFPLWLQRNYPSWKIGMISHDDSLVTGWSSEIRKTIEERPALGIEMVRDYGATSNWQLAEGGGLVARSIGSSVTGLGFKVLLIDDIVKDFVTAHSHTMRDRIWNKWRYDFFSRLEPPYLVVAIGTRWHEDDFIGRLLSDKHEGNPDDWEDITFPAIATGDDVLGREPGEPLMTPLIDETEQEALERWDQVKLTVGSYSWSSLYQQTPSPAEGTIFDAGWWRYWTTDPAKLIEGDESVVMLDPASVSGTWLDSWDFTFKGTDSSDYVVGQRWMKHQANRYLIAQQRGRWSFTQTLDKMQQWSDASSPYGHLVHQRIVEEAANGAAIIDSLKDKVSGIIPVNPKTSKESRARAVTPEIESGNVYLPHPADAGNEWVTELLSELRNFPHDAHDDQVDALTQALGRMRSAGTGNITVPGQASGGPAMSPNRLPIARRNASTSGPSRNAAQVRRGPRR